MLQQGLVKWSSLFLIVFLMCPRRTRPSAIGKQNYFHARRSNDLDEAQLNLRTQPFECCSRFPKSDEDTFQDGVDDEPGFDLTDDEIRKFKLWPKGIIPYYIDAVSFNDKVLRDRIRSYLNSVNVHTRLSFLELPTPPKDDYTRWVFFANRRGQLGCADHSILHFTNEGVQVNICVDLTPQKEQHVNLGYDCLSTGAELAEAVLAIAGVPPQHNAPDRNKFITIVEKNIIPEKRYLFQKLNDSDWLFHDMDYDVTSAGHYHHHKYSVNGQVTIDFKVTIIKPLQSDNKIKMMGESRGFSRDDIVKLRMLYNYIVKKKENKVPECDKLFRKGHNFKNERPLDVPVVEPRKKPNKYLGLPEETNEFNEDSNIDKGTQGEFDHINGDGNEGDNGDDNMDDNGADSGDSSEQDFQLIEYAGTEVDFGKGNENDYKHVDPAAVKLSHNSNKNDPLLYLSDYQTDGRRGKAPKKNTT